MAHPKGVTHMFHLSLFCDILSSNLYSFGAVGYFLQEFTYVVYAHISFVSGVFDITFGKLILILINIQSKLIANQIEII